MNIQYLKDRINAQISLQVIPKDPLDFNKGFKVAVETPIGISKLVQPPFGSKDEYDPPSDPSQSKKSHNTIHVRLIRRPSESLLVRVESLRQFSNSPEEVQNEALKEHQHLAIAAENLDKLRNQPQPPTNPNGEDFIPEPKPQVPFHQVEANTPGEGLAPGSEIPWLGVTVEPKGPRGDASNLVPTLPGKTYSNTDTEGTEGSPVSELGAKGGQRDHGPDSLLIRNRDQSPIEVPPKKPKPNPKPKPPQ